jgi:hypothetical protein
LVRVQTGELSSQTRPSAPPTGIVVSEARTPRPIRLPASAQLRGPVDPGTASTLLPALGPIRTRALTTYYHSVAEPPLAEPILLLDGDRREIVANTVVIIRAVPTYAPAGRHLVASCVT